MGCKIQQKSVTMGCKIKQKSVTKGCMHLNPYASDGRVGLHKMVKKTCKMIETLACGYSSESTQRDQTNGLQHDMVSMISKIFAFLCFGGK